MRGKSLFVFLILVFISAIYSQARVHLFSSEKILQYAKDTRRFTVRRKESAYRGKILSSDGKVLAEDAKTYELGIHFPKIPKSSSFFMELSTAAGISASELVQAASEGSVNLTWNDPFSSERAQEIRQVKERWRADGISLRCLNHRHYPLGIATSCLIGRIKDNEPTSGLEKSQQSFLLGTDGFQEGMLDRTGAFLPMRMSTKKREAFHGKDLTLTIDSNLQLAASRAIRLAVEEHIADHGSAIILDPKTGDLLAMANWPSFDPTGLSNVHQKFSDFNPNYMGAYEPGSTFKSLTLACALDHGTIHRSAKIDCKGYYSIGRTGRVRCDFHAGRRDHGVIGIKEAIAKSCNIFASVWAMNTGYANVVKFLDSIHILEKPDLGLPSERAGMFNRHEYAKPLQMANVGFGQSITSTPVALAAAYAMFATHGKLMKPRLIKKIGDKEIPPKCIGQPITAETADYVLQMMESVTEEGGTGSQHLIPGYSSAGKTGTAQRTNPKTGRLEGGGHMASFLGFIPAKNPRAVIYIILDKPKGGLYHGTSVAGPTYRDLAKQVIRYYNLPPDLPLKTH